jgi:hypothetical protein
VLVVGLAAVEAGLFTSSPAECSSNQLVLLQPTVEQEAIRVEPVLAVAVVEVQGAA